MLVILFMIELLIGRLCFSKIILEDEVKKYINTSTEHLRFF